MRYSIGQFFNRLFQPDNLINSLINEWEQEKINFCFDGTYCLIVEEQAKLVSIIQKNLKQKRKDEKDLPFLFLLWLIHLVGIF